VPGVSVLVDPMIDGGRGAGSGSVLGSSSESGDCIMPGSGRSMGGVRSSGDEDR
jgi:hypothetical protein